MIVNIDLDYNCDGEFYHDNHTALPSSGPCQQNSYILSVYEIMCIKDKTDLWKKSSLVLLVLKLHSFKLC